jgi:hypothetical protein
MGPNTSTLGTLENPYGFTYDDAEMMRYLGKQYNDLQKSSADPLTSRKAMDDAKTKLLNIVGNDQSKVDFLMKLKKYNFDQNAVGMFNYAGKAKDPYLGKPIPPELRTGTGSGEKEPPQTTGNKGGRSIEDMVISALTIRGQVDPREKPGYDRAKARDIQMGFTGR